MSDEELITNALAALHDSDCLERFYSSVIRDSNGDLCQLSDCASRARKILDKEEKRYKRFIKDIVSLLYSSQVQIANNMDRHWKILSLLEGSVIDLRQKGATNAAVRDKLINDYYVYYSYIFHRALACFESGRTEPEANDCEDAQVCKHLTLDTSYCLVTADKGLKAALKKTVDLVNALDEPKLHTTLLVIDDKPLRISS